MSGDHESTVSEADELAGPPRGQLMAGGRQKGKDSSGRKEGTVPCSRSPSGRRRVGAAAHQDLPQAHTDTLRLGDRKDKPASWQPRVSAWRRNPGCTN